MTLRFNWKMGLILFVIVCIVVVPIAITMRVKGSGTVPQNRLQVVASQPNAKSVVTTTEDGDIGLTSILDIGVPSGTIVAYNSLVVPNLKWALCDGTQGTPDLRGRFILGAGPGTSLTARSINDKGGVEKVALTTEEMPAHVHPVAWLNDTWVAGGSNMLKALSKQGMTAAQGDPKSDGLLYPAGGKPPPNASPAQLAQPDQFSTVPHENMPPFYVLTYIMKI